uniref:Egg-lysin n=1 Tax=Haliotis midae TaxID=36098 RepID=Q25098_9VEST|nr:lysin [Haliotis midae]
MKLLLLFVFAMVVTMVEPYRHRRGRFYFIRHQYLAKPFEVALKVQIVAGFDRKLTAWLRRHGSHVRSAIKRKTLYFVNRRYMQTHWQAYMVWIVRKIKALGRPPTVADYTALGAEIGRRIPLEVTYSFLVRRNLIPSWRPYMARLMAKRPADIPIR